MKPSIKSKIDSTKKFVEDNKAVLAFSAGVVVGVTAIAAAVKSKSWLELTPDNINTLREGGVVGYDTEWGQIWTWIKPESVTI